MKVIVKAYSRTLRCYMNSRNRFMVKDRAHKIVGTLLVFTNTCTFKFFS